MEITLSGPHSDLVIRDPVLIAQWKLIKFGLFATCLTSVSLVLSVFSDAWWAAPLAIANFLLLFFNTRLLLSQIGKLGVRLFVAGTLQHPIPALQDQYRAVTKGDPS